MYTKPEIAVLGDATRVIEAGSKPPTSSTDNFLIESVSAYEPEE